MNSGRCSALCLLLAVLAASACVGSEPSAKAKPSTHAIETDAEQPVDRDTSDEHQLSITYIECVKERGVDPVSAQVLLNDDRTPRHVKTSPEVPAGIHGECFELIGGVPTDGTSWQVAAVPDDLGGHIAEALAQQSSGIGVTSLGHSPTGYEYMIEYSRSDGRGNGEILVQPPGQPARPALLDDTMRLPNVHDMVFGTGGLVGFTSDHSNYGPQVFVGRIGDHGIIRDLHVATSGPNPPNPPRAIDYFGADGRMVAGDFVLDTATDPRFVNTAPNAPVIDPQVVTESVNDDWGRPTGDWHAGGTLSSNPECGASTLYRSVPDGWQRVFAASAELDTVTAVHATPMRSGGGADTYGSVRDVLLLAECPGAYEGKRVYWALDGIDYGDGGPPRPGPLQPVLIAGLMVDEVLSVSAHVNEWGSTSDLVLKVRLVGHHAITTLAVSGFENQGKPLTTALAPRLDGPVSDRLVPRGHVGRGVWLVDSIVDADRLVQVDPETGIIDEELWREPVETGTAPSASIACYNIDESPGHEVVDVTFEIGGDLLDTVTVVHTFQGEVLRSRTSELSGARFQSPFARLCAHTRQRPPLITLMQLSNLVDLAGFADMGADHSIDPTASMGAALDQDVFAVSLSQAERPGPVPSSMVEVPCRLGQLTISATAPALARMALEFACAAQ